MELVLDIRTLSLVTVFFALFFGVGLVVVAMAQHRFQGIEYLGLGHITTGMAFLLVWLRGFVPTFFSVVLSNTLLLGGFVLTFEGLLLFLGRTSRWRIPGRLLLPVQVGLFLYFTYQAPDINARIVCLSALLGLQSAACACLLLRNTPRTTALPQVFTAMPFAGLSLYSLFRGIWSWGDAPMTDFLSAGLIHAGSFVALDVMLAISSFGYLWMTSAMLGQELLALARVDPLTGAYNRRALEELQLREFARARRHGLPLSLLMGDLDCFKQINDEHGHQIGDLVLVEAADLIRRNLRTQDIFSRYGGEEFVVILPDTTLEQALHVAEKLRSEMEQQRFEAEGKAIPLRMSFGVASLSQCRGSWDELLSKADQALYAAKEQGRNRVVADQA